MKHISHQIIQEPGLYFMDEKSPEKIICTWSSICILDKTLNLQDKKIEIYAKKDSQVCISGLLHNPGSHSVDVFIEENAEVFIGYILLNANKNSIKAHIKWEVTGDNGSLDIKILSLIYEGKIILDGIVKIQQDLKNITGHIREDNIFLGKKWSIQAIPSLLVHSNDVKAGHSARIERIPEERLFYIKSRGISHLDATSVMIRNYISDNIESLRLFYPEEYDTIVETIENKISKALI